MNFHWIFTLEFSLTHNLIKIQLWTIWMQNSPQCIALHLSVWHPQWSMLLHVVTFSSIEFPFHSESPSNDQTTAVWKNKSCISVHKHYKNKTFIHMQCLSHWCNLQYCFYMAALRSCIYWLCCTHLSQSRRLSWQCLPRSWLSSWACC